MFVRIKHIKGRPYAYLVANEWTPWGSRQKVKAYLGRVRSFDRSKKNETNLPNGFSKAIKSAICQELSNHGLIKIDDKYVKANLLVNVTKGTVRFGKKNSVIAMNEGFLCDSTIKQLIEFLPQDRPDKTAKKLAELALEAGLKLSEKQFVHLFEQTKLLKAKATNEEDK